MTTATLSPSVTNTIYELHLRGHSMHWIKTVLKERDSLEVTYKEIVAALLARDIHPIGVKRHVWGELVPSYSDASGGRQGFRGNVQVASDAGLYCSAGEYESRTLLDSRSALSRTPTRCR